MSPRLGKQRLELLSESRDSDGDGVSLSPMEDGSWLMPLEISESQPLRFIRADP